MGEMGQPQSKDEETIPKERPNVRVAVVTCAHPKEYELGTGDVTDHLGQEGDKNGLGCCASKKRG